MRENQSDDGDNAKHAQNDTVVDDMVENDEWVVAEEVEEEPGDEDKEKDD